MTSEYRTPISPLQWGLATSPKPGESVSGDLHVVRPFTNGMLLAVIDGIGHGEEAAAAANATASIFSVNASKSVVELIQMAHSELAATRGAVMAVASIDLVSNCLSWGGVGNVDGVIFRVQAGTTESLIQRNGTVGHDLPEITPTQLQLVRGDLIVLASDGIAAGYAEKIFPRHAPQQIATQVLEEFSNGRDDALVLVVKYLGRP